MKIVVSILNWNGLSNTLSCLKSLKQLSENGLVICVTDNASASFEETALKSVFPGLIIFRNEQNLGYAGGHLKAINYAIEQKADAIWILNNDLKVLPETLCGLIQAWKKIGDGLFGSASIDGQSTPNREVIWSLDKTDSPRCTFEEIDRNILQKEDVLQVANIVGYSLFIPMEVIKKHGYMDTSFFLYFEETDYCLRLLKKGVFSYWVGNSKVIHEGKGSSIRYPGLQRALNYYIYRNLFRLIRTHASNVIFLYYLKDFIVRLFTKEQEPHLKSIQTKGVVHSIIGKRGRIINPTDYVKLEQKQTGEPQS